MTTLLKSRALWYTIIGAVVALALPQIFTTGYARSIMILTALFLIFALSYDLCVGHVGAVHLAAPAFFGLGAYVTGLIGAPLKLNFIANLLLAAGLMALFAMIVGIPSFRLSNVTFAIGTLAFATASQQFVNSAVDLTRGPLCVQRIPRPTIGLPGGPEWHITSTLDYYYLLVPLVFLTILIYRLLTQARIGRAFHSVREEEVLASASGVHPLRYKMLAFVAGAAIAGGLGSFQAQYLTLVCPTELAGDYTIRLLIIIFVGGAGSLAGIILGSVIFTVLPELLKTLGQVQVTPAHQMILFGLILLLVITYAPGGVPEIATKVRRSKWLRRPAPSGEQGGGAT